MHTAVETSLPIKKNTNSIQLQNKRYAAATLLIKIKHPRSFFSLFTV